MDNICLSEDRKSIRIIDQTLLPNEEKVLDISDEEEMYEAIKELRIRGAPAIGIFAGYCVYVLSLSIDEDDFDTFRARLEEKARFLNSSRPTAVNLNWAITRMLKKTEECRGLTVSEIRRILCEEAISIHNEDIAMCKAISENGLTVIKDGDTVLTHCNAGPLATSRYGTALGPILLGTERGMHFKMFADETRPLLQGARLTAYELTKAGVDTTLICDNMASIVMKNGWIDAVFTGCDRVAANGDTANKIGTSGVAILAKHYGIPFYILGPSSTIDMDTPTGDDINIELRDPEEIKTKWYVKPMAPDDVKCYNPSFDVTDHSLITAIITEKGVIYPPFDVNLRKLFSNNQ